VTRTIAELVTLVEALERDNARLWRSVDRLRAWRPCPACTAAGGASALPCGACDDTGIADAEHVGERVIA
jgi:hypothetical protein